MSAAARRGALLASCLRLAWLLTDHLGGMMRQFWISFFGSMLGVVAAIAMVLVLAGFALSAWVASLIGGSADAPPLGRSQIVLDVDLRAARLDQPLRAALPGAGALSLIELVTALDEAARDPDIVGAFVRAGPGVTPADAEEIRAALARLQRAGKPVIAHIQSLNDGALSPYMAVSGADEIWMHPSGWFAATGLRSERLFLGDALAQLGAEAQFLQLYEYKGAAEIFTRSGYSEAGREAAQAWLESLYDIAIAAIAEDRAVSPLALEQRIASGPHLAAAALEAGLVDRLGQMEEARRQALARTDRAELESIEAYARRRAAPQAGAVIALIAGQGPVIDGAAPRGFGASEVIASDDFSAAIDAAAADRRVRALIIRLDTGGGSATASDQIAAAVLRARRSGKPVIVSMGSVAASGGYYIAAPADQIIANGGALTGSIGVISGKIAFGPTLERVGVTFDSVTAGGEFTGALSPIDGFTDAQRAAIEAYAQATYEDFTRLVAQGRDLPLSRVEALARGRVWTGAQAAELGLVDDVGGFLDAVEAARLAAGLSADQPVILKAFPSEPSALDQLYALLGAGVETGEAMTAVSALLARPEVQAMLRESEPPSAAITLQSEAPR